MFTPERPQPVDLTKVQTYSVQNRPTKVDLTKFARIPSVHIPLSEFVESFPQVLKAYELRLAGYSIAKAYRERKGIVLMMGAHVIKCGLSPIIIRMMEEGLISCLCLNGACTIHDFELASYGNTSEDVESSLETGMFGMVQETAEAMNRLIREGVKVGCGLGEALGRGLRHLHPPYERYSIVAKAHQLGVPVTVHVAIGTDTIHQHPSFEPDLCAKGSHSDFRLLAGILPKINDGGVILNIGSAVILPEVFLKALTVARNLGNPVANFTAVNMDMIQHYRPNANVVNRPTKSGGTPISLTGHHEIMVPLLYACIKKSIWDFENPTHEM